MTGASAGIGAAIATELADRGHGVTLVARREERLRDLASELEEKGVRAEVIGADLVDSDGRDTLAEEISKRGLEVEVLVNNAGFGGGDDFAETDREWLLNMVRLNVEAVTDLTARYLPGMVERGQGAVLNVASIAAFQPLPGTANYAATKAYVLSLTEAISSEVRGKGVTLTALCPGPVRTEFTEVAGIEGSEEKLPDVFWMSAKDVASQAVRGLEQGKRVVVPGLINRGQALAGRHSPRAALLPIARRLWRSGARD